MRLRTVVLGMLLGIGMGAWASPTVVRDWALHRQWRVDLDSTHPERPARLVEVPWSSAGVGSRSAEKKSVFVQTFPQRPDVRAGMRVTVIRSDAMAAIRLRGTALGTARTGETVTVRAGLGNVVMQGVVRGPGVVELIPEKMR